MGTEEWKAAIGARFKQLRENKPHRFSRHDFVQALQRTRRISVTASQIEKIENGKSFPGFELILAYREFFDTDLNFLLAEEKVKNPNIPDLFLYPELLQYQAVMHEAGFDEEETMRFLCDAARNLTEMIFTFRPELKSPPLKKSKQVRKTPRKK